MIKEFIEKFLKKEEIALNSIFNNHNFLLGWTAKEAEIKWEENSIFGNYENWFWDYNKEKVINEIKNIALDLINIAFDKWLISVCTRN